MREIKFRAWDKFHKKMLIHFLLDSHGRPSWDGARGAFPGGQPLILMQYTGLKDKNGKEIYEGDIVITNYYADEAKFKVIDWHCGTFCYSWGPKRPNGLWASMLPIFKYGHNQRKVEVIGNIYENPELIEKA